ncbi:MAG: hypothetical protein V1774_10915, partial [Candidatus Eisenbacteria bacterium]
PAASPARVIVEVADLSDLDLALREGVSQILLDNMAPAEIRAAVDRIRAFNAPRPTGARIRIEVSGGVTLENVRGYALPGVDYISIGALTHSAPAIDMSLDIHIDEPGEGADAPEESETE